MGCCSARLGLRPLQTKLSVTDTRRCTYTSTIRHTRRTYAGVNYERGTNDGLHISVGPDRRGPQVLAVDNVVICAGQEPVRALQPALLRDGIDPYVIGGAASAAELDAKRAIKQGTELAARL